MSEDTFVLGWHQQGDHLVFVVEASLWPGHPGYEPPRPGEWTCCKRARLLFAGVRKVEGLPDMADVRTYTDIDGSTDYGSINALTTEGSWYRFVGDFGEVRIQAEAMRLEVEDRA
jgi:hypothetical protein